MDTFAPDLSWLMAASLSFRNICNAPTGEIAVITYSSHWADADNQRITRWDNTPHFPDLPGFPDHDGATGQVTTGQPMSIFAVLDEIAGRNR